MDPSLAGGRDRHPRGLRPTQLADTGIAEKLGIPNAYLRTLRSRHLDLYDANVNTWLADQPDRRFLVRGLRDHSGNSGIARALLSDSYRFVDNLDVLMAVLDGFRTAGIPVDVTQCDLTERRMYVKIRSTAVAERAPELLSRYVSPFSGARGAENPTVFAGFVVSNSETGHGSFSLIPQITVQVCDNGMTITRDWVCFLRSRLQLRALHPRCRMRSCGHSSRSRTSRLSFRRSHSR
jgi:hypothetical protein